MLYSWEIQRLVTKSACGNTLVIKRLETLAKRAFFKDYDEYNGEETLKNNTINDVVVEFE